MRKECISCAKRQLGDVLAAQFMGTSGCMADGTPCMAFYRMRHEVHRPIQAWKAGGHSWLA